MCKAEFLQEATRRMIIDFERYFPARFSQALQKDWGVLYVNRDNPLSHDSNHAVITRMPEDLPEVLADIAVFYRSKGISPMFYPAFLPGEDGWLWPVLAQAGFTIEARPDFCMQWREAPAEAPGGHIVIREARRISPVLAELIRADAGGDWTVQVLDSIAGGPHGHIFVGYEGKRPAAMAVLQVGRNALRVDDVLTHPECRGRGYATSLMHRAVSLYRDQYADRPLYLWTGNPAAARIYHRLGFRKVDLGYANWTAWKKR